MALYSIAETSDALQATSILIKKITKQQTSNQTHLTLYWIATM